MPKKTHYFPFFCFGGNLLCIYYLCRKPSPLGCRLGCRHPWTLPHRSLPCNSLLFPSFSSSYRRFVLITFSSSHSCALVSWASRFLRALAPLICFIWFSRWLFAHTLRFFLLQQIGHFCYSCFGCCFDRKILGYKIMEAKINSWLLGEGLFFFVGEEARRWN